MPGIFRPAGRRAASDIRREHDRTRGSARQRGYSPQWDKESRFYIRQHPLCLGCEAVGRITASKVTDHTVPHKGDEVLFWDEGNRQPACRWHHDVVKKKLETLFAAGRIGAADLRLDSAMAKALTLALDPG